MYFRKTIPCLVLKQPVTDCGHWKRYAMTIMRKWVLRDQKRVWSPLFIHKTWICSHIDLTRAVMFSCGIAAYSSTRFWRSSLMFLMFRLWTHLTKLSQKCWIGDMAGLSADQLRTSMSHTVTVRIILVTAAVMLSSIVLLKHGKVSMKKGTTRAHNTSST